MKRAALLVHGKHLIRLELQLEDIYHRHWISDPILEVLSQACPVLESLSLVNCEVSLPELLVMLRACLHLTELVLEDETMLDEPTILDLITAVTAILEARKLKRFTIYDERLLCDPGQEQAFAQLLAVHRDLDYLKFQEYYSYCRATEHLCCTWPTEDDTEIILTACRMVNPLIKLNLWFGVAAEAVGNMLSQCPALTSLELRFFRGVDELWPLCSVVVMHCRLLRWLVLDDGCCPSDDEVISLLTALPYLKELNVRVGDRITFRTLQAIVDNKCCLARFCCGYEGFHLADVTAFRQLAKEAGILPVAWIGPYK